jgi:site-specific DNA recombinase
MQRLAFAYIRRSSYKQQDNNSVDIQKQHIKEFAKRNALLVPDEFIFIEDVTSAFTKRANKRKQLMMLGEKMLEMNVSIIIFYDISRMDRTGYSFAIDFYRPMLEKIPNLQVFTVDTNNPIDFENTTIKLNFLMFNHESEVKSVRAISNLTSLLEQGSRIRPGSRVPYGYCQIEKQLHPNEDAEVVYFIYFLASWGTSFKKIATLLDEARILAPNGGTWNSSTIENILNNPVYTGNLIWQVPKRIEGQKQFVFEDTHKPIITDFVRELQIYNRNLQGIYGRLDTPFLFLNKIMCRHCKQGLSTQNGSTKRNGAVYNYQYYVCKNCNYKVNTNEVHEKLIPLMLKRVYELVSSTEIQQQSKDFVLQMILETVEQIESLENKIGIFSRKLLQAKELNDRLLEGQIFSAIKHYKQSLDELNSCHASLLRLNDSLKSDQFFSRFEDVLKYDLGDIEKRLIILYFIDSVILATDQQPNIQFKSNIFGDFLISKNG